MRNSLSRKRTFKDSPSFEGKGNMKCVYSTVAILSGTIGIPFGDISPNNVTGSHPSEGKTSSLDNESFLHLHATQAEIRNENIRQHSIHEKCIPSIDTNGYNVQNDDGHLSKEEIVVHNTLPIVTHPVSPLEKVHLNLNRLALNADYIKSPTSRQFEVTRPIAIQNSSKVKSFEGTRRETTLSGKYCTKPSKQTCGSSNVSSNINDSRRSLIDEKMCTKNEYQLGVAAPDSILNRHRLINSPMQEGINNNAIKVDSVYYKHDLRAKPDPPNVNGNPTKTQRSIKRDGSQKFRRNGTVWKAPGTYSKLRNPIALKDNKSQR